jgi:hypothetical protein
VKLNGTVLAPAPFTAKPLPHRYEAWLGTEEETRCFSCPVGLIQQGSNELEVTLQAGIRIRLIYLEVALPTDVPKGQPDIRSATGDGTKLHGTEVGPAG